jgi:hypothetical protein
MAGSQVYVAVQQNGYSAGATAWQVILCSAQ